MRENLSVYVLEQFLIIRATLVASSNVKNVDSFSLRKHEKQRFNFHHLLNQKDPLLLFPDDLMRLVLLVPEPLTFGILNIRQF